MKLEPPDPKRCQAETVVYNPWVMGGKVFMRTRCAKPPHWLVREIKAGADGQRGAMTLCDGCCKRFIEKKVLPPPTYTMEWISKE